MTFDTYELKGRAATLKKSCIAVATQILAGASTSGESGDWSDWLETMFADVDTIYDDFLHCPRPEDFATAVQDLGAVMGSLAVEGFDSDPVGGAGGDGTGFGAANTDLSGVSTTGGYMADWTGDAASTFKENYADKFDAVTSTQFTLASVLRHAINAEAAVWQTTADDLDRLSKGAQKAVESCLDKSPADAAAALTVFGAVIGVVAVPLTGGTSLALTFAAVGAGISVAATGLGAVGSGGTDEGSLEGGSPEVVIASLRKRLTKLKGHIADAESLIHDKISDTQSEVAYCWPQVCLPSPQYAHAQGAGYDDPIYNGESNG